MKTDSQPLPPKVQALLDRERNLVRMPHELRDEIWTQLEAELPSLGPSGARRPNIAHSLRVASTGKLAIGLVSFLVGGGGGLALHDSLISPRQIAEPARALGPQQPVAAPVRADLPAPAPAPAVRSATSKPSTRSKPTQASPLPKVEGAKASRFAAERTRLEIARTAVARGDGEAALVAIARYKSDFPDGTLAEESEVLRIQALLAAGRTEDAEAATRDFVAKYPRSLALPALRASFPDKP